MNWGYDDGRTLVDDSAGAERLPLQLYVYLADGAALEGKDLVDVSCGRGGGLAYLARTQLPASALGLDFTPANVQLCQSLVDERYPTLRFASGDAERLPLPTASVDAVMSVEASHCYGDLGRFVSEASRVLRPAGSLLWTDFTTAERLAQLEAFAAGDFVCERAEDLTPHVLRAMRADRARRRELIERYAARALHPLLHRFAASDERSETVQMFERGEFTYALRRWRKVR